MGGVATPARRRAHAPFPLRRHPDLDPPCGRAQTATHVLEDPLRKAVRTLRPRPFHINEVSAYAGRVSWVFLLREAGLDIRECDILEVGTGWLPKLRSARRTTLPLTTMILISSFASSFAPHHT